MTSPNILALWDRLRAAGLTEGHPPALTSEPAPWYVKSMIGVAGWIAACFLLAFVGVAIASVFRNEGAALPTGVVLCGAATAMLWSGAARDFLAQFALALSLAGQVLVVFGLYTMFGRNNELIFFASVVVFEAALALVVPYSIHRTWSTLAAAVALLFALSLGHVAFLYPAVLAGAFVAIELNEAPLSAHADIWQSISAGLALGLLLLVPASLLFGSFGDIFHTRELPEHASAWRGSGLVAVIYIGTVAALLVRNGVRLGERAGWMTLAACTALVAAAWQVTALIAALIVVVLAFASGRRALMGLGLFAMAGALSHYYYALDTTLLAKSVSLLAAGAVLLVARFAVRRWVATSPSESRHA